VRNCDTCAKKRAKKNGKEGCTVLTEMIGRNGDCWSWTDDPNWVVKVQNACREYAGLETPGVRKIYEVDIEQVKQLRKMGLSQREIAKELGVPKSAVAWRLKKVGMA